MPLVLDKPCRDRIEDLLHRHIRSGELIVSFPFIFKKKPNSRSLRKGNYMFNFFYLRMSLSNLCLPCWLEPKFIPTIQNHNLSLRERESVYT
jgi:hypothetical protein